MSNHSKAAQQHSTMPPWKFSTEQHSIGFACQAALGAGWREGKGLYPSVNVGF